MARVAPLGPEVHEDGLVGLEDRLLEIAVLHMTHDVRHSTQPPSTTARTGPPGLLTTSRPVSYSQVTVGQSPAGLEESFGIDGRLAPHPGRGDGLSVRDVHHIASGEHALDVRTGARLLHHDVAAGRGRAGPSKGSCWVCGRWPRRRPPTATSRDARRSRRSRRRTPVDLSVAEDLLDHGVPVEADLLVREGPVLHDLRGAQLVATVHDRSPGREPGEEQRLLDRRVAAAHHQQLLAPEEEAVAGGAGRRRRAPQPALGGQAEPSWPRRRWPRSPPGAPLLVAGPDAERARGEVDPRGLPVQDLGVEPLGLLLHPLHQLGAQDRRRGSPGSSPPRW